MKVEAVEKNYTYSSNFETKVDNSSSEFFEELNINQKELEEKETSKVKDEDSDSWALFED